MRYERKYRIEGLSLPLILQSLRLHPASLRPIFAERQVNNIYFDTPGLVTYKNNVAGQAQRKKYRVRWYGNNVRHIESPQLEVKIRDMELGIKKTFPTELFHLSNLRKLSKEVNTLCPEAGTMLQPVLLNSYKRLYFASADRHFRLTVDYDLRYTPLLNNTYLNQHHYTEENVAILEIKYDAAFDDLSDRITQYIPYRRTKNSKYVTGIDLCYW
jgi:SPX domain protein involved in polyphosphate accumulation